MLPNNEVRVPRARVVTQSAVRDITTEFTKAASSKPIAQEDWIKWLIALDCRVKYWPARKR